MANKQKCKVLWTGAAELITKGTSIKLGSAQARTRLPMWESQTGNHTGAKMSHYYWLSNVCDACCSLSGSGYQRKKWDWKHEASGSKYVHLYTCRPIWMCVCVQLTWWEDKVGRTQSRTHFNSQTSGSRVVICIYTQVKYSIPLGYWNCVHWKCYFSWKNLNPDFHIKRLSCEIHVKGLCVIIKLMVSVYQLRKPPVLYQRLNYTSKFQKNSSLQYQSSSSSSSSWTFWDYLWVISQLPRVGKVSGI